MLNIYHPPTARLMPVTVFLFCLALAPVQAATYYADAARPDDSGDGTGWASAKQHIQAALDLTASNDLVLVAAGLYNTGGLSNWPAGGLLTNRVAVTNAVTLQAYSANPADTVIAGAPDPATGSNGNSAVRGVYLAANARLSGFTVSNGWARTFGSAAVPVSDGYGGGIYAESSSIISNCHVFWNGANTGGGIYKGTSIYCQISFNKAMTAGGIYSAVVRDSLISANSGTWGGGAYFSSLYDCNIISNYAGSHGGGGVQGVMVRCNVISNRAESHSGGLSGVKGSQCNIIGNYNAGAGIGSIVEHCVIRQNSGSVAGLHGGIASNCLFAENSGSSYTISYGWGSYPIPRLINCTVASNSAGASVAAVQGGTLTNCIIYYNSPRDFNNTTCMVGYCCTSATNAFTNLVSNLHNITNAPVFAGINDFHLMAGSPGIDAGADLPGAVTNDLEGLFRPRSGTPGFPAKWDMGCYEFFPRFTIITGR